MPIGEFIQDTQSGSFWKADALKAKKEYDTKREVSGKKYKMVKISNLPLTWVEVEIKDEVEELVE